MFTSFLLSFTTFNKVLPCLVPSFTKYPLGQGATCIQRAIGCSFSGQIGNNVSVLRGHLDIEGSVRAMQLSIIEAGSGTGGEPGGFLGGSLFEFCHKEAAHLFT